MCKVFSLWITATSPHMSLDKGESLENSRQISPQSIYFWNWVLGDLDMSSSSFYPQRWNLQKVMSELALFSKGKCGVVKSILCCGSVPKQISDAFVMHLLPKINVPRRRFGSSGQFLNPFWACEESPVPFPDSYVRAPLREGNREHSPLLPFLIMWLLLRCTQISCLFTGPVCSNNC